MSYREHAPPVQLAPWLECVWERVGDGDPVRVIPDGCIDIVWTENANTLLIGPNTRAFTVPLPAGAHVAGARFHPGAASALLGIAAEEVRDVRAPVEHLWNGEGGRLVEALSELADPPAALRAWLLSRSGGAPPPDPLVREAARRLGSIQQPSISTLARELSVSERQLRRRVQGAVGYGPKRLARVFRLLSALDAARTGEELARVAFDAGYADQAHFSNECRELAGVPPSVILAA